MIIRIFKVNLKKILTQYMYIFMINEHILKKTIPDFADHMDEQLGMDRDSKTWQVKIADIVFLPLPEMLAMLFICVYNNKNI